MGVDSIMSMISGLLVDEMSKSLLSLYRLACKGKRTEENNRYGKIFQQPCLKIQTIKGGILFPPDE